MTDIPGGVGTAGPAIVTTGMATKKAAAEVTGTGATTGIQTTETGADATRRWMRPGGDVTGAGSDCEISVTELALARSFAVRRLT